VRSGRDPGDHRFILVAETTLGGMGFVFVPASVEMTRDEACAALLAQGLSESDANLALREATDAFRHS